MMLSSVWRFYEDGAHCPAGHDDPGLLSIFTGIPGMSSAIPRLYPGAERIEAMLFS
jgi:hypothetical protein